MKKSDIVKKVDFKTFYKYCLHSNEDINWDIIGFYRDNPNECEKFNERKGLKKFKEIAPEYEKIIEYGISSTIINNYSIDDHLNYVYGETFKHTVKDFVSRGLIPDFLYSFNNFIKVRLEQDKHQFNESMDRYRLGLSSMFIVNPNIKSILKIIKKYGEEINIPVKIAVKLHISTKSILVILQPLK